MIFEWFVIHGPLSLRTSLPLRGALVVLAYAALTLILIIQYRYDFSVLTARRWAILAMLMALTPLCAWFGNVRLDNLGAALASQLPLPVVGLLPALVAAIWLGRGPAIAVGIIAGLSEALAVTGRVTQPFEMALLILTAAWLLNQCYRGRLASLLRQPSIAMAASGFLIGWPLTVAGIWGTYLAPGLASLELAVGASFPALVTTLFGALIPGLIVQAVLAVQPKWKPVQERDLQPAPWERRLSQRIALTLLPLSMLAIIALVGMVAATSYRVATRLVVDQMARDAASVSNAISSFAQVGRSLIHGLASDQELVTASPEVRQRELEERLHTVSFFQRLTYFNSDQQPVNMYPSLIEELSLTPEETGGIRLALAEGVSSEMSIYPADADRGPGMSFVAPIVDARSGEPAGALLGTTELESNPMLAPVVDILRSGSVGSGTGFLIDEQNRILLFPAEPSRQTEEFILGPATETEIAPGDGRAFRRQEPDGTRSLIYILPVEDRSGWSVVVVVPNEVTLSLAAQIALPALLLLLGMVAASVPLAIGLIRRVTGPVNQLLDAVDALGQGEIDTPVGVSGEDEIGRLGVAFEQMRVRLRDRLNEQERLLRISRSVAASLELFRAMPPILSSALEVANAVGVRVVIRTSKGDGIQSYAAGEAASIMAPLDGPLTELVEKQGTVVISQIWRASGSLDTTALLPRVQALVALPLRSETVFHGILWLAYDHEHTFEQPEMTFLSTLAGQAALSIANNRLFTEAEEERRKLEAVLQSTADAMIVVDLQGRVVLMNPAAEKYLGIRAEQAQGKPAEQVIHVPQLAAHLTDLEEPVVELELSGQRGKTLLANISTIVSHDGAITGRVAVMRDITPLKELDNIKTVFLRMVSHDLRSPLTYMRGYLSMLPLAGELNERQQEAIEKVGIGIDNISDLTERLLYLSRLQFGDEAQLDLSLVDVETLINEVTGEQERAATERNITMRLEAEEKLPLLTVDEMLYRQALANLVSNALKYAPEGSEIVIRAYQLGGNGDSHIIVAVSDNGIGIREEDQPRLFEAFYRVPQREGEPPRPRGSGLGLALVKAIAIAHGGTVGVQSEFGHGSTFHISLPVRRLDDLS